MTWCNEWSWTTPCDAATIWWAGWWSGMLMRYNMKITYPVIMRTLPKTVPFWSVFGNLSKISWLNGTTLSRSASLLSLVGCGRTGIEVIWALELVWAETGTLFSAMISRWKIGEVEANGRTATRAEIEDVLVAARTARMVVLDANMLTVKCFLTKLECMPWCVGVLTRRMWTVGNGKQGKVDQGHVVAQFVAVNV